MRILHHIIKATAGGPNRKRKEVDLAARSFVVARRSLSPSSFMLSAARLESESGLHNFCHSARNVVLDSSMEKIRPSPATKSTSMSHGLSKQAVDARPSGTSVEV